MLTFLFVLATVVQVHLHFIMLQIPTHAGGKLLLERQFPCPVALSALHGNAVLVYATGKRTGAWDNFIKEVEKILIYLSNAAQ